MRKVSLIYYFDNSLGYWSSWGTFRHTLQEVKDITDRLDRGLESVQQNHLSIECEVKLQWDVHYVVFIRGESDQEIGAACGTFAQTAGLPNRVHGEVKLAEPALRDMGYSLKRNWRLDYIAPLGRDVVRLEPARL